MARNPKQDANLKPCEYKLSREEAKRGGKKSGETRRALKTFKEALIDGLTEEEQAIMLKALKRNAMRGNLAAYEFFLKQIGQHPDQLNKNDSDDTAETGVVIIPARAKEGD